MSNKLPYKADLIVESLLLGTYELSQFPGLVEDSPLLAKRVIGLLLDRAREYRIEAEVLKLQLRHLKEVANNQAYKVPHEACIKEISFPELGEYYEND